MSCQVRRNRECRGGRGEGGGGGGGGLGGGGGGVNIDSKQKKGARNTNYTNSLKTTGNFTLVHLM